MSRKLVSLFSHPEFARRAQARATQQLAERVLGPSVATPPPHRPVEPGDEPPEFDSVEAFLAELFRE